MATISQSQIRRVRIQNSIPRPIDTAFVAVVPSISVLPLSYLCLISVLLNSILYHIYIVYKPYKYVLYSIYILNIFGLFLNLIKQR